VQIYDFPAAFSKIFGSYYQSPLNFKGADNGTFYNISALFFNKSIIKIALDQHFVNQNINGSAHTLLPERHKKIRPENFRRIFVHY